MAPDPAPSDRTAEHGAHAVRQGKAGPTGPAAPDDVAASDVAELGGRGLLGLAAVVVGAVPFLVLLALVEGRWAPLQSLDAGVAASLNDTVARSPGVVRVLRILTEAGSVATAVVVFTATTVWLLAVGRRRLAAYVAVAGIGLAVLVPAAKALVGRARPEVALPVVELPGSASFPSGHAMTSTVTWGVLLLVVLPSLRPGARRGAVAVTVVLVLVVGSTRVALGVHYVSDVVAGWAFGFAWLAVVTMVFRRWLRARGEPTAPVGAGAVRSGSRAARPTLDGGRP